MRFPKFFARRLVSQEAQDWVDDNFDWAVDVGFLTARTPLVLPTREFFPSKIGKSPEAVQSLVGDIARLLGLEDRVIQVSPLDVLPGEYRHNYQDLTAQAGTWQGEENAALIRYDPELVARPLVLIAILVHELMHEKLSWTPVQPPGGEALHELATDLHCITCGFGVIAMNAAEQIGWQGYMRQPTRAYALARFTLARGLDPAIVERTLAPRSASYFTKAITDMKNRDDVIPGFATSVRDE